MTAQHDIAPAATRSRCNSNSNSDNRAAIALQPHSAATTTAPRSNAHRTHSKLNALSLLLNRLLSLLRIVVARWTLLPSPPPYARSTLRNTHEQLQIAALRHCHSATSRGYAGHIANDDSLNSRTTDARGGARSQAPHRPPDPCLCTHRCRPRRSHTKPRHGRKLESFLSFTAFAPLRGIESTPAHFHGSSKATLLPPFSFHRCSPASAAFASLLATTSFFIRIAHFESLEAY